RRTSSRKREHGSRNAKTGSRCSRPSSRNEGVDRMSGRAGRRPFMLKKGEGQSVWSLGGRFTLKVTEADADKRFSLVEALAFRSTEPPLHIHHHEDEAWYILDGQLTFYVGHEVLEAMA